MNEKFYVVLFNGKLTQVDTDGDLVVVGKRDAAKLFDDYDQARGAIRKTVRTRNRLGLRYADAKNYNIQRLVL